MNNIYIIKDPDEDIYNGYRVCARAIVLGLDGKIMLLHYRRSDFYQLPGGGKMSEESTEECAVREVEEETGYKVKNVKYLFCVIEKYEDYKAINYYFLCKVISDEGTIRRTGYELESDIHVGWHLKEKIVPFIRNHIRCIDPNTYDYRMEQKELYALIALIEDNCL